MTALRWLGIYLALVLAPMGLLVLVPMPAGGGFWWEVGIAAGFAALSLMALQFLLTARLRRLTAPFGIDIIYYFHRFLAYALILMVILHPLLLLPSRPALWTQLGALPWYLLSGTLALLALLLVTFTSQWRRLLRLPYNSWRVLHLTLALAAVVFTVLHVRAVGYYSAVPIMRELLWLMLLVVLGIVVWVRLLRPWWLMRQRWRVSEVQPEPGDAWTLALQPENGQLMDFLPGQLAWLSIGHSPFSMQEHPFSISSAPGENSLRFTIKALGDFTAGIGELKPDTVVYVDGPYGVFSCDRYPQAPGYVFVAGGIGIAPMLSMLQALADRGDKRPHCLITAHSALDRIPGLDRVQALQQQLRLHWVPVLEQPPAQWQGERGWLSADILQRHLSQLPGDFRDYHYFLCGPVPMLKLTERLLQAQGVPMAQLHTELFDMA